MWLQLKLNISVGERCEEVEAENVSIEKTRETGPIANREELKGNFVIENLLTWIPEDQFTFSSQNSSSEIVNRPMTCEG